MVYKEMLNCCYKFFNKFINASQLIDALNQIDKSSLSKKELKEFNNLLDGITNIENDMPYEQNQFFDDEEDSTKTLVDELESVFDEDFDKSKNDFGKNVYSHDKWYLITDFIDKNKYFNTCFEKLSDYELLEFIGQYISAPFPPKIDQDTFEKLVSAGKEKDEREWLWRLAFNYEETGINFDSIVDYFIEVKDGYYLSELICAVGECLDIDSIMDKIDDEELIRDLYIRKSVISHFVSEHQFNKLIDKCR